METAPKSILLVEDDPNFGAVLRDYLELHDYQVTLCTDGLQGLSSFRQSPFDACILDVMLPKKDGFTLAREIKALNKAMPVVFLTAKAMKNDVVEGFKIGADDYLTKPFDSEILLYKLKVILSRKQASTETKPSLPAFIRIGKYTFEPGLRTIRFGEQVQKLSPKENELLTLLCHYRNQVMPREEALLRIWKTDDYFTARSMDVYITKIRKYLKDDLTVELVNVHGNGFRLNC